MRLQRGDTMRVAPTASPRGRYGPGPVRRASCSFTTFRFTRIADRVANGRGQAVPDADASGLGDGRGDDGRGRAREPGGSEYSRHDGGGRQRCRVGRQPAQIPDRGGGGRERERLRRRLDQQPGAGALGAGVRPVGRDRRRGQRFRSAANQLPTTRGGGGGRKRQRLCRRHGSTTGCSGGRRVRQSG